MDNHIAKPVYGQNIIINIEKKGGGQIIYPYTVLKPDENFLVVAKTLSGLKVCISNVKDSGGKRIKGMNPPFIRDGVYTFPCVEV